MRLNRTRKGHYSLRRKTKKNAIYGGVKPGLRANAAPYVPPHRRPASPVVVPVPPELAAVNEAAPVQMIDFMSQFLAYRQRVEGAVALDCEMVGVGAESALAHVAIVDFEGKQLYNKYVLPKGGIDTITDYRARFSGMSRAKLVHLDKVKHSYETVRDEVEAILRDRIIVGHGLINDFTVLEFVPKPDNIWDTTMIDAYKKAHPNIPGLLQAKKLKLLAKEIAGNSIQKNDGRGHSPLEDARASMNLYRINFMYPKVVYGNMSK